MPKIVVNRGKLPDLIISRSLAQLAQKKDIHRNTASAMLERGEIVAVKTKIGKWENEEVVWYIELDDLYLFLENIEKNENA